MIAVNLRGAAKINRRFKRMPNQLKQKLSKTIRQTAIVHIETVAKNKLTSDKHIDTGRLRASIHTEWKGNRGFLYKDRFGKKFGGGLLGTIKDDLGCIVGTNVEYAKYVERKDSYLAYAFKKARPILIKRVRETLREVI
jgi:hypothetical protein